MRVRVILIVAALAIASAGLCLGDGPAQPRTASGSSGRLAGQPAPDPALPAIVNAAVTTSAGAQTLPHAGWRRQMDPVRHALVAIARSRVVPGGRASPLTFPLLI